ncbi:enoyl-CoA hydratase/isomerase family protein [Saccharomonospora sp. NPDC006951]
MSDQPVLYERRGPAAWITLNRPGAHNALSAEVIAGIGEGLRRAEEDTEARAIVLAGNGPSFCAGADLKMVLAQGKEHADASDAAGALSGFLRSVADVCDRISAHPLPVIAAVHGNVIAGGLELTLACDLVLADEKAAISDGHARYGLFPAAGGATRLPRKIGVNRAKYLLFTADTWSAELLRECGLVNEVLPEDELLSRAQALAERLGHRSARGLAAMKRVVEQGLDLSLDDALALELAECERYIAGGGDFEEGLLAFTQRRVPVFGGRDPV